MFYRSYVWLAFLGGISVCTYANAQTVIGMGTENPNPNAVLELVSENKAQGFLVPRFTTQQRNTVGFTSKLSEKDNGLLIFDTDEGAFFYWFNGAWKKGTGENHQQASVWYEGDAPPSSTLGNDGDFYIHKTTGELYRKKGGSFVVFGNIHKNETPYTAGKGISIDNHQIINTAPDQPVTLTGTGSVSISGSYPDFTISAVDKVDDADADPANELQDLSLSGTSLGLSGSSTTVDLTVLQDGTGTDNQQLSSSKSGNDISLGIDRGNTITLNVADNDNDATNEIQDLQLNSNKLKITNNSTASEIDLSSYLDNTDQQDLSLNGNTFTLSGDATDVKLSATTPTDGQVLKWNVAQSRWESQPDNDTNYTAGTGISVAGNQIVNTAPDQPITLNGGGSVSISGSYPSFTISGTDNVNDADADPTNEKITSVSLITEDVLRISEAGTNHDIDMSSFQKTSLPENQILIGSAANVAAPVSISGDIILNSDGTMTITLDAVTTAKIINSAITTAKLANDAVTKDKINADVAGNGLSQNADGSLEINIGNGLQIQSDQLGLVNKGDGEILVGDGSQVNAYTVSGDLNLSKDGMATVEGLQGRPVSNTAPATDDLLVWDGSAWKPQALSGATGNTWYQGTTTPSSVPSAPSGSFYFKTDDEIVYRKSGATWTELGKWVKTSNSTVKGANITSTRTPTVYIGTGDPRNDTDNNAEPGDFYFDTSEGAHGKLYIKKNDKDWHNF